MHTELPNIVTIFGGHYLAAWENTIFSLIIITIISLLAYFSVRKLNSIPNKAQNIAEVFASGLDEFICGILGPKGRKYTPFIGTLFIYIIIMNVFGLIPFMKSPTTSWSITLALALCVFCYVQYSAFKEFGVKGYVYHLMGEPKGFLAFSVVIPLLILFLHIIAEFVKPISLSLRLRSNIWGEDILLAIMAGFGIKGIVLLFFNTILMIFGGLVQAGVFCLLTTIYFALVMTHEENVA